MTEERCRGTGAEKAMGNDNPGTGETIGNRGQGKEYTASSTDSGYDRRKKIKIVIIEAIRTLEESRKSFKSKRLAELRKKLLRILEEET